MIASSPLPTAQKLTQQHAACPEGRLQKNGLSPQLSQSASCHPSIHSIAKRLIDKLGAIVGLVITALLLIPLSLIIYLDNPGPIFFSQTRCGLNGKTFQIWKFRTMIVGAELLKDQVANEAKGLIFKNVQDPRITRIGRLLRKTSLDEFPQFWNVLRGEMSLVGTRPPTLDEVAQYEPHHWQRLQVRPGITGEWQAHGRSQVEDFEDIVALDLRYQQRWTVTYDIYLLFKTVFAVVRREGAC
jgi:lipopolysaccharide/colanic/teichoic acid biosynthesis glycosyltransferase